MKDVKTGLICIGLKGERLDLAEEFLARGKKALKKENICVVNEDSTFTLSEQQVQNEIEKCLRNGAQSILFMVGTWIYASHVIGAAMECSVPIALWGLEEAASFSVVGTNVLHGSMGEMGIEHELFYGLPEKKQTMKEIHRFCTSCALIKDMRGRKMGLIGGRAIGAYPTSADPNQVKEIFGVEVEHLDQLLLYEKVRKIPENTTRNMMEQVRAKYGKVEVPENILAKSVNVYFGLKEIIDEYDLDMCTMKCIGEFMNTYTSGCLALTMLNDAGYLVACQCNINAMLSSYILNWLSEEPVFFGDINLIEMDTGMASVINCGSIPGKLAENYGEVEIVTQYKYMGDGRGACTLFCMKEGPVTFGTLERIHGKYVMNTMKGTAQKRSVEELKKVRNWAQGFVQLDGNCRSFFENIRSNHSVLCYGDVLPYLKYVCKLLHIEMLDNR